MDRLEPMTRPSPIEDRPSALVDHVRTTEDRMFSNDATVKTPVLLPIELHEHIIGFLDSWYDAGTIANCALVCSAWVPFSRYKLYFLVKLRYRQQWIAFKNLVFQYKAEPIEDYFGMVQELYIWPHDENFFEAAEAHHKIGWHEGQERPWTHLVLVQCAARLLGLTKIDISQADFTLSHVIAIHSGHSYRAVTDLNLSFTKFLSVAQLHEFITAFPALQDLSLFSVKFKLTDVRPPVSNAGHALKSLDVIALDDAGTIISRYFAVNPQLVRSLSVLHWRCTQDDVATWTLFVAAIQRVSLNELEYRIEGSREGTSSRFILHICALQTKALPQLTCLGFIIWRNSIW